MNTRRTTVESHMKATSKMLAKRLNKTAELAEDLRKERDILRRGLLLSLLLSVKWSTNKKSNFDRRNSWEAKIGREAIPRTDLRKHETFGYDSDRHEETSKTHVFVWTQCADEDGIVLVCSDISSEKKVRAILRQHLEDL